MADNSGLIIKVGIFGAVAYYAYSQGWLSSLGIGTATTASTTAASTTAATTAAAAAAAAAATPGKPKLATIQAAVILAANAPAAGLSVDNWGWYLNNALAPYGMTAPDPMPLFSGIYNALNAAMQAASLANGTQYTAQVFSRSDLVTSSGYWNVMGPTLQSQLGLSGLGMYRWTN